MKRKYAFGAVGSGVVNVAAVGAVFITTPGPEGKGLAALERDPAMLGACACRSRLCRRNQHENVVVFNAHNADPCVANVFVYQQAIPCSPLRLFDFGTRRLSGGSHRDGFRRGRVVEELGEGELHEIVTSLSNLA